MFSMSSARSSRPDTAGNRPHHEGGKTNRNLSGPFLPQDVPGLHECDMAMQHRGFYLYLVAAVVLSLAVGYLVYQESMRSGLQQLARSNDQQAVRYSNSLEREIEKYGLVSLTASLDFLILDFLQHPEDEVLKERANHYLEAVNISVGAHRTYVVNTRGTIIASSNWQDPDSFVGRDISYRPYFQKARPGSITPFYGIGTTDNAPGYFLATAAEVDGKRIGVVAIKVKLEQLEHLWITAPEPVLLSDANDVVVLSSEQDWKYRILGDPDPEKLQRMHASQQYNRHVLQPLQWRELRPVSANAAIVVVGEGRQRHEYLSADHLLPDLSMRLTVLADPAPVRALSWARASASAVIIAFVMAVLHALNQWRISIRQRLSAQAALQAAHDQLETLVEKRSAQLRTANEGLRREIAERIQAAKQLENFQQELIRAENLAVIGQLSAGLAHEINQPLAAMSTLSANAIRFLERGDAETVSFNLQRITDLVERMGVLTGQLRSFARRSNGEQAEIGVDVLVENAVALLGHRLKKAQPPIRLQVRPPSQAVAVYCDSVRLEQVLVNLIGNAMDAIQDVEDPRIEVGWQVRGERVLIQVRDNGTGLSGEVIERLFEPFFTTKTRSGLGLGLAISADIIKSFGGSLSAGNVQPGPGAEFTIDLPKPVQAGQEDIPS